MHTHVHLEASEIQDHAGCPRRGCGKMAPGALAAPHRAAVVPIAPRLAHRQLSSLTHPCPCSTCCSEAVAPTFTPELLTCEL